jgi:hypothetical protein
MRRSPNEDAVPSTPWRMGASLPLAIKAGVLAPSLVLGCSAESHTTSAMGLASWATIANAFDEVIAFDPALEAWSTLATLPRARHGLAAATLGSVVYFVGGGDVCAGGAVVDMSALTLPENDDGRK